MPIKKIKISNIVTDAGTDVRSEINEDVVQDYSTAIHAKEKFPPLVVFDCGDEGLLLADGFHRYFGYLRQGVKEVECDVRKGIKTDALKFALKSNTTHGYRRTNDDKRNAVEIALREFPKHTDRALAEMCAVGHPLVAEIRKAQVEVLPTEALKTPVNSEEKPSAPPKRVGRDGKEYKIPTRPASMKKPEEKPITKDATGIEVPEEIVPYWDQNFTEAQRLLTLVSEVRTRVKRAKDSNEPAFREVDHTDIIAKLDQVFVDLKRAKPYAVCPECNGVSTKGCSPCKGRGYVSEFYWKHSVAEEIKKSTGRE